MAVASPLRYPWLPEGGGTNLAETLASLMWIVQVHYQGFGGGLVICGYIIPPEGAVTEGEILAGMADSLEEILDVLDQAGATLTVFPEIQVSDDNGLRMQVQLEVWDI